LTGDRLNYNYYDYDPQTGRYVESDPIGLMGGDYSTYLYVGNNPSAISMPWGCVGSTASRRDG
jgi:RHS repeat-associated protein